MSYRPQDSFRTHAMMRATEGQSVPVAAWGLVGMQWRGMGG